VNWAFNSLLFIRSRIVIYSQIAACMGLLPPLRPMIQVIVF